MKRIALLMGAAMSMLLAACGGEPTPVSSPSAHEHDYEVVVTSPTCTEKGYTTHTCSCGDFYVDDYVDALGHELVLHEGVEPTCTEGGSSSYYACSRCDYATEPEAIDPKGHSYGEWIIDVEATCLEVGSRHKECADCGDRVEETIPAIGEHDYVAGVCTVCKDVVPDGTTVEFGNYPQTQVTDETLITALSSVEDADGDGYVEYEGTEYLKTLGSGLWGYDKATTYYFEVEPITWKFYGGMLMAEKIIDVSAYYTTYTTLVGNRTVDGEKVYSNNYMYSTVRAYLNGYDGTGYEVRNFKGAGFIDKAFTTDELEMIATSTVDNSAATTNNSSNSYACANTEDKIFLLSYWDAINADYGYSTDCNDYDTARVRFPTDYAKFLGCSHNSSTGAGDWWLRSPTSDSSSDAGYILWDGGVYNYGAGVYYSYGGLAPALKIAL